MAIKHVQPERVCFSLEFALDIIPSDRCDRKTHQKFGYLELPTTFTAIESKFITAFWSNV